MRILHVSDFHFERAWYDWVKMHQHQFDVICLTGDLIDYDRELPLYDQITWVTTWLNQMETPVLCCSGNHDIDDIDHMDWLEHVPYGDNRVIMMDGVRFGTVPFIGENYEDFTSCDVLLRHVPPSGTKVAHHRRHQADFGDQDFHHLIKSGVLSPKLVLSGHIHHPREQREQFKSGIELCNPGRDKTQNIPNHLVIDFEP